MQIHFCKDKNTYQYHSPVAEFQRFYYRIIFQLWCIPKEHWVSSYRTATWIIFIILSPFMPQLPNPLLCSVSTICISFAKRGKKESPYTYFRIDFFFQTRILLRSSEDSPICLSSIFLLYGRPLIIFIFNLKYCVWMNMLS